MSCSPLFHRGRQRRCGCWWFLCGLHSCKPHMYSPACCAIQHAAQLAVTRTARPVKGPFFGRLGSEGKVLSNPCSCDAPSPPVRVPQATASIPGCTPNSMTGGLHLVNLPSSLASIPASSGRQQGHLRKGTGSFAGQAGEGFWQGSWRSFWFFGAGAPPWAESFRWLCLGPLSQASLCLIPRCPPARHPQQWGF